MESNTTTEAGARWLIVTGISGSGRTTSLRALEDLGWFCVDNLPVALLPALAQTMQDGADVRPVAVGIDVRAGSLWRDLNAALRALAERGLRVGLLFLDCADDILIRRFAETRRKHPVLSEHSVAGAIARERQLMLEVREHTSLAIDTSELNIHELKARIHQLFADPDKRDTQAMVVALTSFGFKHGVPRDADYLFDARGLANPHFIPELQPLTGLEAAVARYVLETAGGGALLEHISALLRHTLPLHRREGRALVTIGIGCTGGRHRSVALTEALARQLSRGLRDNAAATPDDGNSWRVVVTHRDATRDNQRLREGRL